MKRATDQLRLLIAERLIMFAMSIAPKGHKDSVAIIEAALHVSIRRPS